MSTQESIERAVKTIAEKIKPATLPLGIKLIKSEEQLPVKAKRPSAMGNRWALCQAIFAARSIGWMVAIGAEDQACPVAQALIGFNEPIPYFTDGNLSHGMCTETLDAGALSEQVLPRFDVGEYKYVLIGPLAQFATMAPDLVYVYGMPGQITRLIHAALYKNGGNLTSSFTGRGGCVATIAGTLQKDACQVVVNGNGERVFGHAQDHEMSFAIPWNKLDEVIDGIEATHKAGVRYPYPAFVNFTPQFPPKYHKMEEFWTTASENRCE